MSHEKFEEILFSAENRVVGSYTDSLLIFIGIASQVCDDTTLNLARP